MQKRDGMILFSASDLIYFSACKHRTWLDRLNLDRPMEKAADDEQSKLVQDKGNEHEAAFSQSSKTSTHIALRLISNNHSASVLQQLSRQFWRAQKLSIKAACNAAT